MDEIDAQIEAARAELAALRAEPEPSIGRQLAFDIPVGVARAGAGLADVLSYPVVKGLEYAGAPVETFGLSKLLSAGAEQVAPTLGVQPETGTQELVSFLTPSPLSKAKLLSQAGTGLASYLGMKGAEKAMPESQYAGLVGALAGPGLATGAGKLAGAGVRAVSPAVGIAAGSDEALRAAAQAEVLRQAGPEGVERLRLAQEMPELVTGTGGVPLTAAEIVQTPSLAQYQQEIAKKAGATDILGAAREARGVELQAALERLGITPETGDFGIALRDAAEQAAKKKAASEGSILRSLGLTEDTKGKRKAAFQQGLLQRETDAYKPVKEAWKTTDKTAQMDVAPQLVNALSEVEQYGINTRKRISSVGKDAIKTARNIVYKKDGLITVGEYQDLRATANAALRNPNIDPAEKSIMMKLKTNLDSIDESSIIKGDDPAQLNNLINAISETKKFRQTFGEGVVGQIVGKRRNELRLKASQALDIALKYPENAEEIVAKFGRNAAEATELRAEMLARLDKAKNPTDFLGRNKDTLKAIFGSDYDELNKFAQQKGRGTGLEQFERITDTQIPNKIFADVKQANAFMQRFQGTELEQYARAKFIKTKLTKSGNAVANLDANKKIAQRLFGADYGDLQKVINDLELSKAPSQLAKAASKGQSITSQSLTSLGAIAASRGVIGVMKQGALPSSIVGGFGGGWLGATAGLAAGAALRKTGQARELQMDKFVAEILANPSLIKFAAAPPTEVNIRKLIDIGQTLQRGGVAAGGVETPELTTPTEAPADIDAAIETARQELEALRGASTEPTPQPETVKVGKQNISIPTGEEYAPPSLVKAVMKVESAGKQEAVSPKGATGLMQLMPATAKDLGVDPTNAQENVEGGSRYLQQLISKYGKTDIGLAAYNWGQGNVDKAIRKLKAEKKAVTWANIMQVVKVPMETRLYVNKVLKNREVEA